MPLAEPGSTGPPPTVRGGSAASWSWSRWSQPVRVVELELDTRRRTGQVGRLTDDHADRPQLVEDDLRADPRAGGEQPIGRRVEVRRLGSPPPEPCRHR